MLALSKDGKVAAVVENLVVTALALDKAPHAKRTVDVAEIIESYFGLKFIEKDLQSAIDRLLATSKLLRAPTGELIPAPQVRADIDSRVHDAQALEARVREEWLNSLSDYQTQRNASTDDELWACLRSYMAKAFEHHGAQTTMLLDPRIVLSTELDKSLAMYLKEAVVAACKLVSESTAKSAIRQFFLDSTPSRSRYIAQLLDGTFSFYAICVDEVTSTFLKGAIQPVSIFLDTNFVFGLLKLHENPMNEVSEELVAAIQTNQFPFKLYYHERTLGEFHSALNQIRQRMVSFNWSQELSRAAVRTRRLGLIETRFHEANSARLTDPRVFLTKYEHVETILLEKGFSIYREPQRSPAQKEALDKERTLLVERYNAFLVNRLGMDHAKRYRTIDHDMLLWQTVKGLRRQGTTVLDIGALFLTADNNLYAFDWQKLRGKDETGHIILPNQLLQLLRPFLVVTSDFDKKFAATFAIPEFRTLATGYSVIASRILGYLTTLADVTEETASRILANEVLLGKLRNVAIDAPEFKKAVDSALVYDNGQLIKENQELLNAVSAAQKSRDYVATALGEKEQLLAQQERLLKEQRELAKLRKDESKKHQQQVAIEKAAKAQKAAEAAELRSKLKEGEARGRQQAADLELVRIQHQRLRDRIRISAGAAIFISGLLGFVYLQNYWAWLENHSKRLGLSGSVLVILAAVSWAIGDPKGRGRSLALTTIAVGALFALIQVIDPDRSKPLQSPPTRVLTSPTPSPISPP